MRPERIIGDSSLELVKGPRAMPGTNLSYHYRPIVYRPVSIWRISNILGRWIMRRRDAAWRARTWGERIVCEWGKHVVSLAAATEDKPAQKIVVRQDEIRKRLANKKAAADERTHGRDGMKWL
jgi:hypothetical protein